MKMLKILLKNKIKDEMKWFFGEKRRFQFNTVSKALERIMKKAGIHFLSKIKTE